LEPAFVGEAFVVPPKKELKNIKLGCRESNPGFQLALQQDNREWGMSELNGRP
jgi:hypothetical protein